MIPTIRTKAENAAFYYDSGYYRIDSCDNEYFYCHDEDTCEEYVIEYSAVPQDAKFYKLVEIV